MTRSELLSRVQHELSVHGITQDNFGDFTELDVDHYAFQGADVLRKGSVEGTLDVVNLDAEVMLGQGLDETFTKEELFKLPEATP